MRSKSHWNYPKDYLLRCRPALKIDSQYIQNWPVVVLECDQERIGFYSLKSVSAENRLDNLWVDLPFIGKGHGRALLMHALDLAKEMRWSIVRVAADPGAENFYKRFGAIKIGMIQSKIKPDLYLPHMEFTF